MRPQAPPPEDASGNETVRLKRAVLELSILNELAVQIGARQDSQEILERIVQAALRAVQAEEATIVLTHRESGGPTETIIRARYSSSKHRAFQVSDSLLGWMYLNSKPLTVNDPRNDRRFPGEVWDSSISSVLSVPQMIKSRLIGVLTLYNKKGGGGFSADDQRLAAILASQSAQVVENARLYEEERRLLEIEHSIENRCELREVGASTEELVRPLEEFAHRCRETDLSSECGVKTRHEHGGPHALTRHIAEREGELTFIEPDEIE